MEFSARTLKLGWALRVCQQPGVNARLGPYIEIPAEIVADTVEDMNLKLPPTKVNIADISRKYHAAARRKGARSQTAEDIQ